MAVVNLNKKEIIKITGKTKDEELDEILSLFGTPVEKITESEIEIEVAPNRPDMLSQQGLQRALKSYLKKETGLKKYKINRPEKNYSIKIDSSVKDVRPFTVCAIIKNLFLDNEKIKEIIDLQEKLHSTIGRNRKKASIGIYPLEKITLPITYKAEKPEKIKFIPLDCDKEMTAHEILKKHPTGKNYASLLKNLSLFPIFIDANSEVLSMPPIINSEETGRVDEKTKEVFIECSGSHLETLNKTLNIIVTTLADMGGEIYSMNLHYGSKLLQSPDLTPEKIKVSLENINKLLGLNLKEKDIERLLPLMGYEYKNKTVYIPAWRTDILHEVDIIEDIAIAYGYNNLIPEVLKIFTMGEESEESKFYSKIASLITGLGITEISSYHLIKQREAEISKLEKKIEVENSKTEYKILRPNLLIPALRILSENKNNDYPQKIFEIGTVFSNTNEEDSETGVKENENLFIAISPGNFTNIKQILNYITNSLKIKLELKEEINKSLIEGRTASISLNGKNIGYLGEVHPETLHVWTIKMPISVLEISLDEIFQSIKKSDP